MPDSIYTTSDLDLISVLRAIPDGRMRRGIRIPAWYLLLVAPLYRRAQHCLTQVHQRLQGPIHSAKDDPLPKSVLALCPQLEPHLAHLLEQLCSLDPDVRERLFLQPEGEMMAVLDVLEPVG